MTGAALGAHSGRGTRARRAHTTIPTVRMSSYDVMVDTPAAEDARRLLATATAAHDQIGYMR